MKCSICHEELHLSVIPKATGKYNEIIVTFIGFPCLECSDTTHPRRYASKKFSEYLRDYFFDGEQLPIAELLSLRWKDIDFPSKTIQIRNSESFTTKSRKNRVVPISEILFRLLETRKNNIRNESEYVFPDPRGKKLKDSTISQKFKRYIRQANLNDKLHFHSLRHSFATHMVKKGVPILAVQKLLGHASSKTTEIYSHLSPEQLHREVNVLGGLFKIEY